MALTQTERQQVWRGMMRWWSAEREEVAFSKAELFAAVEDLDVWFEANQAEINQALPEAFRTLATPEQKTLLLCAVAAARMSIAFARKLFGEVD